jgi:hypothetical protein
MVLTMEDTGIKKAIVLGDAGFGCDGNYKNLSDPQKELEYIIPLRRNTSEINTGKVGDRDCQEYLKTLKYEEVFTYHGRAIDAHSEIRDGYRIRVFRDVKMAAKEKSERKRQTRRHKPKRTSPLINRSIPRMKQLKQTGSSALSRFVHP